MIAQYQPTTGTNSFDAPVWLLKLKFFEKMFLIVIVPFSHKISHVSFIYVCFFIRPSENQIKYMYIFERGIL